MRFRSALRLASSQRDGNPPDLPDRRERQRAGADTQGVPGVRARAPQLPGQHHGLRRRCRPQRGAVCLRAAFFPRQRSPQLDHLPTQRYLNAALLFLPPLRFILQTHTHAPSISALPLVMYILGGVCV